MFDVLIGLLIIYTFTRVVKLTIQFLFLSSPQLRGNLAEGDGSDSEEEAVNRGTNQENNEHINIGIRRELELFIVYRGRVRRYQPTQREQDRIVNQVTHDARQSQYYRHCFQRLNHLDRRSLRDSLQGGEEYYREDVTA
jgi:hypothetical protein